MGGGKWEWEGRKWEWEGKMGREEEEDSGDKRDRRETEKKIVELKRRKD